MSLDFFRVIRGVEIENDALTSKVQILLGTGLPGGDAGEQDAAPRGSVFLRTDVAVGGAQFYWKSGTANTTADWEIGASKDYVDSVIGGTSWRAPARVMDDTVYVDDTAFPVTGIIDGVTLADQDRVLFSNVTASPENNIWIWNSGSSTWTEDPLNPESDGDVVFIQEGTSSESIMVYTGSDWVKYADATSFAELGYIRAFIGKSGVGSEMPDYSSTNVVADSDSLETAIGKLDAEDGYQNAFMGKAVGNEMPTYTSTEVVTQNGSLEAAVGELDAAMGNGNITNTGGNYSLSSDMTWNAGLNDVTEALDQLNAAIGDRSYSQNNNVTDGQSSAASIEALDVAIGNRTYTEDNFVTDGQSVTASIDALDIQVGYLSTLTLTITGTNVDASPAIAVDTIPVTEATEVKWMIQVRENGTPANRRALEIHALTDGTAVDHTEYAVIKVGANIAGFDVDVVINGANIELMLGSTNNVDFVVKRISYSAF